MDTKQEIKIQKKQAKFTSKEFQHVLLGELLNNFSKNELRSITSQQKAFSHDKYWVSYSTNDDNNLLGFMLWWDLHQIRFVEYLYVATMHRCNGIGSKLLKSCIDENTSIVVEVKEGASVEAFYIKNGFLKNDVLYKPIPLQTKGEVEQYSIFSYKSPLDSTTFNIFNSIIHQDEYQF